MPGRKEYKGAASPCTLTGAIGAADTTMSLTGSTAGWPTGASYPFVLTIDGGNAGEEKVLCSARTGGTVTITTRGYDGTTATSHAIGAPVEHRIDADSLDTFGAHAFDTTRDDHTQYLLASGARVPTAIDTWVGAPSSVGTANADGVAEKLARQDHVHGIAANAVGTTQIAAAAVTAAKIANDTITAAQIAAGAIGSSELAAGAVTAAAIAAGAVGTAAIATDAVTATQIAAGAVGSSEIATDAVGSAQIAAGAVGSSEIAADAVTATQIAAGAVGTSELAAGVRHYGSYSGTCDGSSNLTVAHGAGFTPAAVFCQHVSPSGGANQGYPVVTAITATTFTIRYLNTAGSLASQAVSGFFECLP